MAIGNCQMLLRILSLLTATALWSSRFSAPVWGVSYDHSLFDFAPSGTSATAIADEAGGHYCLGACSLSLASDQAVQPARSPLSSWFGWILDTTNYPPRWHCGTWSAGVGWLHILSDIVIWLSYLAIPMALLYYLHRRKNPPLQRLLWLFSAFILCCGTTHLMEAIIFWWPAYGLAGVIKLITAVVSAATVLVLLPIIPKALQLKTPDELEQCIKERTQELAAARHQANLTIEASPVGMLMIDQDGKIILFNSAAEKIFGYARHEVLGQSIEMLVPDEFRTSHVEQRDGYFENPTARSVGARLNLFGRRADGSSVPVEIGLNPVRTPQGMCVLSSVVDITERKHLEEKLNYTNEVLLRSNRDLQQFAYVASHDLQEPLRKISSYATLIREEYSTVMDSQCNYYLDVVIDGANRLQKLTSDLLTLSRISSHGTPLEPVAADEALAQALENLEFAIDEKKAQVTFDSLPRVMADPNQLVLLFQNLLGNALKYSGERRPEIHVGCRDRGERCEIFVRDNGIGIESEHFERIFELFQRLHTRGEYEGTGIGLALCKRIVDRMGGQLRVESKPGAGSTFFFWVSKAPQDPLLEHAESVAPEHAHA